MQYLLRQNHPAIRACRKAADVGVCVRVVKAGPPVLVCGGGSIQYGYPASWVVAVVSRSKAWLAWTPGRPPTPPPLTAAATEIETGMGIGGGADANGGRDTRTARGVISSRPDPVVRPQVATVNRRLRVLCVASIAPGGAPIARSSFTF